MNGIFSDQPAYFVLVYSHHYILGGLNLRLLACLLTSRFSLVFFCCHDILQLNSLKEHAFMQGREGKLRRGKEDASAY